MAYYVLGQTPLVRGNHPGVRRAATRAARAALASTRAATRAATLLGRVGPCVGGSATDVLYQLGGPAAAHELCAAIIAAERAALVAAGADCALTGAHMWAGRRPTWGGRPWLRRR